MWNLRPSVTENVLREYAEKEIERSFTLFNLQHYLVDTTLDFDEEERRIYLNVNFSDELAIDSFEIRFNVPENYEYEGVDEVLKQANDDAGDVLTKFGKLGNIEDIANIITQFSSEFVEDEAGPTIDSIQKEFTPGVTRVIGNLTKRIAELEHEVKNLVQVTGGGY